MEESGFSSPPLYSHNVTTHPMRASTFFNSQSAATAATTPIACCEN